MFVSGMAFVMIEGGNVISRLSTGFPEFCMALAAKIYDDRKHFPGDRT